MAICWLLKGRAQLMPPFPVDSVDLPFSFSWFVLVFTTNTVCLINHIFCHMSKPFTWVWSSERGILKCLHNLLQKQNVIPELFRRDEMQRQFLQLLMWLSKPNFDLFPVLLCTVQWYVRSVSSVLSVFSLLFRNHCSLFLSECNLGVR